MLMTEYYSGTWNAFPRCLDALSTHRLLLITFELPLPASEAAVVLVKVRRKHRFTYHPVRERISVVVRWISKCQVVTGT